MRKYSVDHVCPPKFFGYVCIDVPRVKSICLIMKIIIFIPMMIIAICIGIISALYKTTKTAYKLITEEDDEDECCF